MKAVSAAQTFRGSVSAAQSHWYDVTRWASWVDGFDHVVETSGAWPQVGSSVTWQSGPAGRGRVTERVTAYAPLEGQTLEVEDDAIRGRQQVAFTPADEHVEVKLSLEYEIKKSSFFTPLIDLLFIRRAMTASLHATLERFRGELSERAR
ncbi:MAG: SRPBCC family protein [Solirubrobacteraceae bacterium]